MSRSRVAVLTSLFALLFAIAFSAQGHAQISAEAVPKILYVDSYFGPPSNPFNEQAYLWTLVTGVGDSTYLATPRDQFFGIVSAVKFVSGSVTTSIDGFNTTGSGFFMGTMQATTSGTLTVVLKDYFSGAVIYSATLKKTPGFIYILK